MPWPPKAGDPLPRAVERKDADVVWNAIAKAVLKAVISEVRGEGDVASYGVLIELTINDRTAPVLTAWHYSYKGATPRLVTAYPKPYTRRNGNYG